MKLARTTYLGTVVLGLALAQSARAAVTVELTGSTLKIKGDAQNDIVFIDGLGAIGEIEVTANGANPVAFAGVRSVLVSLAGGDDFLEVSALQIGGDFKAKLGDGNDQAFINDAGTVDNSVLIGRDVDLSLGGQSGDIAIIASAGLFPVIIGGNVVVRGAAEFRIKGDGGTSGSDARDVTIGGDLRIQSSVAALVQGATDTLVIDDVNVGGRTRITLGGDADAVRITTAHFARGFEMKLGGGDDVVDFDDQASAFNATFTVDGGAGDDLLHHVTQLELEVTPKLKNLELVEAFP